MSSIIGHKEALQELEHDIGDRHISHGYLFTGPAAVGKFSVAKWFTKKNQCEENGCGTCPCCKQIDVGSHIDTIEVPDDGSSIKIEQIRDIIARLNMTPQSAYKVLILKNIGRMTGEAANCILKTLEEPTEKTILIFTTDSLRTVLPTITSRMRIIRFRRLTDEQLYKELQKKYPDLGDDLLEPVVTLALGKPGRAVSLIEDPDMLHEMRELHSEAEILLDRRSPSMNFLAVEALTKSEPVKLKRFMEILLLITRKRLLETDDLEEQKKCTMFIEEVLKTQDLLRSNVNARLLLENLLLSMV